MLIAVPPNGTGAALIREAARLAAVHGYAAHALYVCSRPLNQHEFAGLRAAMREAQALGVPFDQVHALQLDRALATCAAGYDVLVLGHARLGRLADWMPDAAAPLVGPEGRLWIVPVRAEPEAGSPASPDLLAAGSPRPAR